MRYERNQYYRRGNALLYVLLGIALFGALTFILSRSTEIKNDPLSEELATLLANEMIAHVQQVQQAVVMMEMTGTDIDDLDFVKPGETGFDTAPHTGKIFHPAGGGISVMNTDKITSDGTASAGWYYQDRTNVAWTDSTAHDVIYTFVGMSDSICEKINTILHGIKSIPQTDNTTPGMLQLFDTNSGNSFLTTSNCSACEGYYQLCIERSDGAPNAFYTIIASR